MNKFLTLITLIGILFSTSCANRKLNSTRNNQQQDLAELVKLMTGEFSSKDQSIADSLFYNINLVMYPIWENDKSAKWLYVEQAVTKFIDKPYRQRVYKVTTTTNGIFESGVYKLPNQSKYIHGWNNPEIFNEITPDSLIVRQGCAVYLKKSADNCYVGSTKEKECKSTLRGASYATSEVNICKDQVLSWDQGWDENDKQVWGAETEGYMFKKVK